MLREKKKARTRKAIIEASLRLFWAKGFDATTVDEIAESAEVSRRTFFRYFETKEAVFFANMEARLEAFEGLLADVREGESPIGRVQRACLTIGGEYMREREMALAQHRVIESSKTLMAYDQRLDATWEKAIIHTLTGTERPDEPRRRRALVLSGAIIGAVRAVLRDWFIRGATDDLIALGHEAFGILNLAAWEHLGGIDDDEKEDDHGTLSGAA